MSRYTGVVRSWDVVNETVDNVTGEMRQTVLSAPLGERAVDIAFQTARQVDPHAQLVYNDYMGWEPWSAKHRAGVLRLLERFRKDGVPVDALGLQSHISTFAPGDRSGADRARDWRAFLDEVTGMGYALLVTEFDVQDKRSPGDVGTRDAAVAAVAKDYLDLTLSYAAVQQVVTWGLVDRYSWLRSEARRADGLEPRGLPYDDDDQPTPLRRALSDALAAAPARG
jgi:endo-1,4-beta-xylanase